MRWKDGNVIGPDALNKSLTNLRRALQICSQELRDEIAAGDSGREACDKALFAVTMVLELVEGFSADTLKPLSMIGFGFTDLDRGNTPKLFKPKRLSKGGAPKRSLAQDMVRAFAVAAVEIAIRNGVQEGQARKLVISEFSRIPGMVGESALKTWRSHTTGSRPPERFVSRLVEATLGLIDESDRTAQDKIRVLAKMAGRRD